MKFNLHERFGALNSKPVFNAFRDGALALGHDVVLDGDDGIDVIWSVLFHGRMGGNKDIWERNQRENRPTIVLEVGGIKRGTTWKVGLNGINRDAFFGYDGNDDTRSIQLGLKLLPWQTQGKNILICGQHDKSLQWTNMSRMSNWFLNTYDEIRKYTDKPIIFRPHPRCRLEHIERGLHNVTRREPQYINGTYDDFDMGFNDIFATVSWSSNPGIHSIINGVPAFVGPSSLAYPVANDISNMAKILDPIRPDRQQWLNDYAHTEWTVEEISQGIPINHLTSKLN
tara:strand:- start:2449 stop:3300 length:852 start_codon:yes stop_codon:yes gene_type:complete